MISNGGKRVVRKPFAEILERFFTRKNLKPFDSAGSAVRQFGGVVEYIFRGSPDIRTYAISFDERYDWRLGYFENTIRDSDVFTIGRGGQVFVHSYGWVMFKTGRAGLGGPNITGDER